MRNYLDTSSTLQLELVDTESLIRVYQAAVNSEKGILIGGPKGVGKSTSLLYVFHKLTEDHPNALMMLAFAETLTFSCNDWKSFAKELLSHSR